MAEGGELDGWWMWWVVRRRRRLVLKVGVRVLVDVRLVRVSVRLMSVCM